MAVGAAALCAKDVLVRQRDASVLLDEGGSRRLRRGAELIAFGGLMAFAVCLYLFAAAKESERGSVDDIMAKNMMHVRITYPRHDP